MFCERLLQIFIFCKHFHTSTHVSLLSLFEFCKDLSSASQLLYWFQHIKGSVHFIQNQLENPELPRVLIDTPAAPGRYPRLVVNYVVNYFFPIKVDPLHLEYQNQTINIPVVVLPSNPIIRWGKSVKRFLSYDRTQEQTQSITQSNSQFYKKNIFIIKTWIMVSMAYCYNTLRIERY